MLNYTLGTIEASEALIKDLYIDLRANKSMRCWVSNQTVAVCGVFIQAKMFASNYPLKNCGTNCKQFLNLTFHTIRLVKHIMHKLG